MRQPRSILVLIGVLAVIAGTPALRAPVSAQGAGTAGPPDLILSNGKIVTVDERFTLAQAVAVRGERVMAVGTNQDIGRLAGPATRRIDLRGRTVLPGLIDNHMHLLRYGTTWKYEVRWDGIESRKEALALLRARAERVKPGEWIYNLGGWAVEQFSDDSKPFTREELDAVAPNHPVFLQASYYEAFLNSRALQLLGIDDVGRVPRGAIDSSPRGPAEVPGVVRDAAGRPTGRISEEGFRPLVDKLPIATDRDIEASTLGMIRELNQSGLTAFGSAGCETDLVDRYRRWAAQGQLNIRVFCITTPPGGGNIDQFLPRIAQMKVFQGDSSVDDIAFGENFGGLSDPMFRHRPAAKPEDLAQWRRIVTEVAKAGLPLHVHTNFTETIDAFLDQIEAVNREYPIRNLRWVLAHFNQPTTAQLERMKRLGMYAAVHPWAVINGGINIRQFGDAAYDMAPLATIQRSGITWGLGSDGSRANQILPFRTLGWAVTGKMVGGKTVLKQPVSREDALIAHTRKNAYFIFRENDLGSIEPGKLADFVVVDRDYLTVPADDIKNIKVVMTMVGGRIVYDAAAPAGTR
jgi:predicted amidohydrolase YtcJ